MGKKLRKDHKRTEFKERDDILFINPESKCPFKGNIYTYNNIVLKWIILTQGYFYSVITTEKYAPLKELENKINLLLNETLKSNITVIQ